MTQPATCRCGHEQSEHFHAHRVDTWPHDLGPIIHGTHWYAECLNHTDNRRGCTCSHYEPWNPAQVAAMLR